MNNLTNLKQKIKKHILAFDAKVKELNSLAHFTFITEDITTDVSWLLGYTFTPELGLEVNLIDQSYAHFHIGDKCKFQLYEITEGSDLEPDDYPEYNNAIRYAKSVLAKNDDVVTWVKGLEVLTWIRDAHIKDTNILSICEA